MNPIRKIIREEINNLFEGSRQPKKEKRQNIDFIGAIVENDSEIAKLNSIVEEYVTIPEGWTIAHDYHMTILKRGDYEEESGYEKGEVPFSIKRKLVNQPVELKIVAIGKSDKAIAFKEEGDMFSKKDTKHITIAYLSEAKDSDEITDWEYLPSSITIQAVIRQIDPKKNIIPDIQLDERGSQIGNSSAYQTGNFQANCAAAGAGGTFPYANEEDEE